MGGELFGLLERMERLPEPMARFYVGSVALAFQHIHHLEYVYRDLKPENVLLDGHGYVKLCDFGFAKKVVDRTYTQCGTPDYTAPEMLLNQGVNQACDWWALGVVVHELVSGYPPFTDGDGEDMKTFAKILKGDLTLPEATFSSTCRDLIRQLLQVKVVSRLGYLKGGADDVLAHPWFADVKFDWDGLVNKTMPPPWVPRLASADDDKCFDSESVKDSFVRLAAEGVSGPPISAEDEEQYGHVWQAFGAPTG